MGGGFHVAVHPRVALILLSLSISSYLQVTSEEEATEAAAAAGTQKLIRNRFVDISETNDTHWPVLMPGSSVFLFFCFASSLHEWNAIYSHRIKFPNPIASWILIKTPFPASSSALSRW